MWRPLQVPVSLEFEHRVGSHQNLFGLHFRIKHVQLVINLDQSEEMKSQLLRGFNRALMFGFSGHDID